MACSGVETCQNMIQKLVSPSETRGVCSVCLLVDHVALLYYDELTESFYLCCYNLKHHAFSKPLELSHAITIARSVAENELLVHFHDKEIDKILGKRPMLYVSLT